MNHRHHIALACLSACCVLVGATSRSAAAPCEPRDLGFDQSEIGWAHQPLSKLKREMTDTDNTGKKAVGEYADIRFECAGK